MTNPKHKPTNGMLAHSAIDMESDRIYFMTTIMAGAEDVHP